MPTLKYFCKVSIFLLCWLMPIAVRAELQITELLPDPIGDDGAEWIEIYNNSSEPAATQGWIIKVKERSTILPARTLNPQQYLTLTKAEAGFTLTNTGANLTLIDPTGKVITAITYTKAPAGQSYALINGSWQWTKTPTPGAKNLAASPPATKKTSSTNNAYPLVTLHNSANLASGDKVTVEGIIAAGPGEINATTAFINGWQLNFTGSWPTLKRGDAVRVRGSVSLTKSYGLRILIKSAGDITVLQAGNLIQPLILKIRDVTAENEGQLISVTGQISKTGSNWFTLSDESEQIKVTLKNPAIKWPKYSGEVNVSGLVTLSNGEIRLWPRDPNDIKTAQMKNSEIQAETIKLNKEKTDWRGYLILLSLAIVLLGGWMWEQKKLPNWGGLIKKLFKQNH